MVELRPAGAAAAERRSAMDKHLSRFRAWTLLACVPAVGLMLMASVSTARAAGSPGSHRTELRTALEHLLAGWHPTNHAAHEAVLRGTGLKQVTSGNWSGYA